MSERSIDLELRLYAAQFADLGSAWQPRLMIFVRGSTMDVSAALLPERAAAYRPGVLGVYSDDPAASQPAVTATSSGGP